MGSGGHHQLIFGPSACHGNMLFQIGSNTQMFPAGTKSMISMEENPRIRPFFTSPDEIYDEEYYDELLPEKKRRLTTEQVHQLEKSFEVENKLEPERKTELAKKLGLQPRQVAVWFQNRRARWKTKQLERDYDLLKSSYDSLMLNYDAIIKENDKLKSEVITLNDKLQGKGGVDHEPIIPQGPEPELALEAFQVDSAQDSAQLFNLKADDRLSSGSGGGSALVNNYKEDTNQQLVVDSSTDHNCYFPDHHEDNYPTYIRPFQSDGDDGSDDCPSYGSDVFVTSTSAADQQHHQEEEGQAMGWWVW